MTTTTASLLFNGLIDYAGLFPPAKLPLDQAFFRFLGHRDGRDGRLLARFVCPAARLDSLADLVADSDAEGKPLRVAVLATGGDDPPAWATGLEADIESILNFRGRLQERAVVDVIEGVLPVTGDPSDAVDLFFHAAEELGAGAPTPYFEFPLAGEGPDPSSAVAAIAAASHEIDPRRRAGIKIRCGGLTAAAVPSVEAVSAAVAAARDAEMPLKATQGLHHPVRRRDSDLDTTVHGFVNLVAAVVLAREHRLDTAAIAAVLAEEEPAAFTLGRTSFAWRDLESSADAVAAARRDGFTSFGSCSFTEPRDELAALGWL